MAKGKVTLTDEEKRTVEINRAKSKDRVVYQAAVRGAEDATKEREVAQGYGPELGFLCLLTGHPSQQPRFWTEGELTALIKEQTAPKSADSVVPDDFAFQANHRATLNGEGPPIVWTQWAAWFGAILSVIALSAALCR
jgi:hypothetical protein